MFEGFQDDPIAERKSDVFGLVQLYPPKGDPVVWGVEPWLLVTQHGEWTAGAREDHAAAGMKLIIRRGRTWDAYTRPGLIQLEDIWIDESAEVETSFS